MEWPIIVILVLAVPIIILPVALVWYLNIAGIYAAAKEARKRKPATEKEAIADAIGETAE